jgi:hypothetical protein
MRLWSVRNGDREQFFAIQGEALTLARSKHTTSAWIVFEYEVAEQPRGELLANCLNYAGWKDVRKVDEWTTGHREIARFFNGKAPR